MHYETSDDVRMLTETLRRFLREELIPLQRREKLEPDVAPPDELRQHVRTRSKELGLYAADLPAEVGGGGLPFSTRCRLEMEAHSHDTVFFDDVLGGPGGPTSVLLACTPAQRERYLLPLVRGETSTCFALTEPGAGSDAGALQMRAQKTARGYRLNGTKSIITNAVQADFAMVFAVTDPNLGARGGITCFLVDRDTPGYGPVRPHTCMGFHGFQGELVLQDCEVRTENILGQEGLGLLLALDWINTNRIKLGAAAVGITRRLLGASTTYARERRQFGAPIGDNQLIQAKLADMATELYAAESMVFRAAWMRDQGIEVRTEAAMTKLFCSELVNRAAYEAIQIHGGAGCLREGGIERVYRQSRVLTIVEGTSEIQRVSIARSLLKGRWGAAAA
ncbi:acyl-CoA dehydrogenase family protein [Candidatus Binatia bacterium]|nr:acyl-CoA dehydrogenase family protein [Candidatus Binatia bacterium]